MREIRLSGAEWNRIVEYGFDSPEEWKVDEESTILVYKDGEVVEIKGHVGYTIIHGGEDTEVWGLVSELYSERVEEVEDAPVIRCGVK